MDENADASQAIFDRTTSRELQVTTGAAAYNLDEEQSWRTIFAKSWDTWGYRSGAKSASLETDVFAQRDAVHATIGLEWYYTVWVKVVENLGLG